MKSEEIFQIWENCSPAQSVIRESQVETFINCLKGTIGEDHWDDQNDDAKCISEKLSSSKCKTNVQQENGFQSERLKIKAPYRTLVQK